MLHLRALAEGVGRLSTISDGLPASLNILMPHFIVGGAYIPAKDIELGKVGTLRLIQLLTEAGLVFPTIAVSEAIDNLDKPRETFRSLADE